MGGHNADERAEGDAGGRGGRRAPGVEPVLGLEGTGHRASLHRFSHEAMATVFEVHAEHPDARYAAQAAHAVFELIDRLERELSRFLPNSDIARINRLAAGERTRVSASTLECLAIARHVYELTGGAFDVSIGTDLPSLELDPDAVAVHATAAGTRVDLGGIGKGYAVDLAAELLEEWGLDRALVHGGFSSVLALDPPAGRDGWPLTFSDPLDPSQVLVRLAARQLALGASGLRKGAHIVDPRAGNTPRGRLAAWVAVPRPGRQAWQAPGGREAPGRATGETTREPAAAIADGLTTAFMLLDTADVEALCAASPGVQAWIRPEAEAGAEDETRLLHFGRPLA